MSSFSVIFLVAALCAAIAHMDWVPVAFLVLTFLNEALLRWATRNTTRTVEDEF